jgi:hypothetical protein
MQIEHWCGRSGYGLGYDDYCPACRLYEIKRHDDFVPAVGSEKCAGCNEKIAVGTLFTTYEGMMTLPTLNYYCDECLLDRFYPITDIVFE